MRYLCAALIFLAGIGTASADIRIDQSRYANGEVTIVGETSPDAVVTLDDKYKTKSDAGGHFKFTEPYKPFTCMSDIRSGSNIYSAVIAGCLDPGFTGDTPSLNAMPSDALPVKKTSAKPSR
ncbi:MAG TPA: hypothetical protein VFT69_06165 [Pseudolabrys sp.]|jgi:hypothetical protein|nr:hypothetical protein [Pseudolabrys sp.]